MAVLQGSDPKIKWDTNIKLPSEEEMRMQNRVGCRFYPRCPMRMDRCLEAQPPFYPIDKIDHEAACFNYENVSDT